MTPLLAVENLHVAYCSRTGADSPALVDVQFHIEAGETLGVLGESGSGKSTLAAALLSLLPANGKIHKGTVRFEGEDLLQMKIQHLEKIRGNRIGVMLQEPSLALHPTIRIVEQIRDVIGAHKSSDRRASREAALSILAALFSTEAKRIGDSYAHQLSGGQRQRVLLAQAIACGPTMIVADEPTASLDPSTQQEILVLLRILRKQFNLSMMLISHNPAVLASLADRILVLYAGRIAEIGPADEVLNSPQHPYTRALLACLPSSIAAPSGYKSKLPVIPGESPNPAQLACGCRFEPRCAERMDVCAAKDPAATATGANHSVSCFKYGG